MRWKQNGIEWMIKKLSTLGAEREYTKKSGFDKRTDRDGRRGVIGYFSRLKFMNDNSAQIYLFTDWVCINKCFFKKFQM